ncbi:hypothetical protein [Burkholderia glumae]|uniref:hypothetical protein n=1 Tax=Burkholderia glumae TaxID=337 RepID=UPI000313426D|nr:hypothetical protein [Burkholderia glumae]PJO24861.1 hypothetical protein Y5A_000150 [Burkholderia glumae AU6208]QHE11825.1 hypothetical protein GQR88_16385 [Burkholderia glumae AU6208]QHE11885.1 hypothetical protein GQR88_16795 [Burkholderia glumae AU6208]
MKERPILFSAPMVRATLDGRKTQTRRVVKHQPPDDVAPITVARYHPTIIDRHGDEAPGDEVFGAYSEDGVWGCKCPYGEPGDRLWVRETWSADFARHYPCERVWYAADDDRRHDIEVREGVRGIFSPESNLHVPFRWRPSIHMPRALSRITLEITGVRVERLRAISESDAIAEGVEQIATTSCDNAVWMDYAFPLSGKGFLSPGYAFKTLWESINGAGSWDANPWIWVIEFKRVEGEKS